MEPNGHQLSESLLLLDRSMEDVKSNRVELARQAIVDIAKELGLNIERLKYA